MLKNFRSYQLAKQLYRQGEQLKLKRVLKDQFDRASLSVVLNLAEGTSKPTKKDRVKYYHIALASLRECQAILDIVEAQELFKSYDVLGAHVWNLIQRPGP